jgi:hypothetical protein
VASRPTPDPEVVPLLRAIKARIDGLSAVTMSPKDGLEIYHRNKTPFLQLEIRRDHMSLDLWLSGDQLEEARASGIARAHPFLGDEAVKVRFERAEDLSKVARWIEASYEYAPNRGKKSAKKSAVKTVESTKPIATPPPSAPATPATSQLPAPAPVPAAAKEPAPKKNGAARSRPPAKAKPKAKKAAPVKAKKAKAKPKKTAKKKSAAARR